jgi:hypothetical protein
MAVIAGRDIKNVKITQDNWPLVQQALDRLTRNKLYVGFPDSTTDRPADADGKEEPTNAQIGYWMNFGVPASNIPARPFMTLGVASVQDAIVKRMGVLGMLALAGDHEGVDKGFAALGLFVVSGIRKKLRDGPWQPLSPRTVMARIHARTSVKAEGWVFLKYMTPLIDTSAMLKAITYVVRNK